MKIEELKPNVIVKCPIFPEPVQVIVAIPVGDSVKLGGKGLNMGWEPLLKIEHYDLAAEKILGF